MKVRPYERSTLWRAAFSKRKNDPDERDREALAEAYRQLRDRAGDLVGEIHAVLPQLTVHDLTHADALWDVASEICGPKYVPNPLEAFVLGASFLLHDAGMALAAYPGGLPELKSSAEYRDAIVTAWKKSGVDDPTKDQRSNPNEDISNEAIFQVLRSRHASQAKVLATALWIHPATGHAMALVQNDDLLESYGELIGNISASHHWPITEVARFFGDPTPASAAWPRAWEVDGLTLACILRCAGACAIVETRAPSFLFALRKPQGTSKRHWTFQNKIYPAKRRDDALVFESKSPFHNNESDDWWLCFDAIAVADQELRSADALLSDRKRQPLLVRRVAGANSPDILMQTIKVDGWKPVNTQPKISDPQSIIERLGGRQLYGDQPLVPIRELIQNAVDAIRARRFVDLSFRPTATNKYPGKVLVQIARIVGTQDYWIGVEDDGIGMSERVVTNSLLDFGTSFWSSETAAQLYPGLPSEQNFRPIGKFGIGFYSIFMYSELARVVSREFRAAKDAWNVLIFDHGLRGRGKFSIERSCAEVVHPDASTRVSVRVDESFLWELSDFDSRAAGPTVAPMTLLEKGIASKLVELVLPLDVTVSFSFLENDTISLNEPLLYEKDRDTVWSTLESASSSGISRDWLFSSPRQKELLIRMGNDDQVFGYCGLNILGASGSVLKSVGGLGQRDDVRSDPIWGVAEYSPAAANRSAGKLAAPQQILRKWVDEQIDLIKHTALNESEVQNAIRSLGSLDCDVRPIVRVLTTEGPLTLDKFVEVLCRRKAAIFPIGEYESGGITHVHSTLPMLEGTSSSYLHLRPEDIKFDKFVVYSDAISATKLDLDLPDNRNVWGAIIGRLRELNVGYEICFVESVVIGKYAGPDSPLHNIATNDGISSGVVELKV
jgi:hypothetical protein